MTVSEVREFLNRYDGSAEVLIEWGAEVRPVAGVFRKTHPPQPSKVFLMAGVGHAQGDKKEPE